MRVRACIPAAWHATTGRPKPPNMLQVHMFNLFFDRVAYEGIPPGAFVADDKQWLDMLARTQAQRDAWLAAGGAAVAAAKEVSRLGHYFPAAWASETQSSMAGTRGGVCPWVLVAGVNVVHARDPLLAVLLILSSQMAVSIWY
eukprot:366415-Chlamydomonas_euryale.AAC.5